MAEQALAQLDQSAAVRLPNGRVLALSRSSIVVEKGLRLPGHRNGMTFVLSDGRGEVVASETYYSIGGGFVVTEAEMASTPTEPASADVPFPFGSAAEMLAMGDASGLSVAEMKRANEFAGGAADLDTRIMAIWAVMDRSIERGLRTDGILPGGLNVRRRAKGLNDKLRAQAGANDAPLHSAIDWLSAYAMAVNEENAAGGQVVTAPTNGAPGVIPAVIRYNLDLVPGASPGAVPDMLLTAAAIGGLIKTNASISGAEVGCQGEVGSASAMAAAALCAALGGTNAQSKTQRRSRSSTIWG